VGKDKMTDQVDAILFDLDNTLINTQALKNYRENSLRGDFTQGLLDLTKIYPKTRSILDSLAQRNIPLGVVTNSPKRYALKLLEHYDLTNYFKVIITYDDVKNGGAKPSPIGINLALAQLGLSSKNNILFIGDEENDVNASYAAGVKPIAPAWASKEFIGQVPAAMLSTSLLLSEIQKFSNINLIADRCANENSFEIEKKQLYFIPMTIDGQIGAIKKDDIDIICLGRYFSQGSELTARIHDMHPLSKEIYKKELSNTYVIPEYWVRLLNHFVEKTPAYIFNNTSDFNIVTVIPSKKSKNPRLENMLNRISRISKSTAKFIPDLFEFQENAKSLKTLGRKENRQHEIGQNLRIKDKYSTLIGNAKILIIDDVVTTGATFEGAFNLLSSYRPERILGICLAKTVSVSAELKFCPDCGRRMKLRMNHKDDTHFWGCTGFHETPQCKHTENMRIKECPSCGGNMYQKRNKKGELFLTCEEYYTVRNCRYTEDIL
jgi:phosphoglycolate phosphatase-like HAD superfamily hydrolase